MNEKFLKPYDPKETESRVYKLWEESGLFNPDNLPGNREKPFTIIMPPPNVTGVLHMGHAMMLTIEDILIRYKRMQGFKTLWIPGTDHAAIATQSVVEKEISKKEGKSRYDLGREELLKRIEDFAKKSHDTITSQVKVMGSSCDWSREAFTLDEKRSLAVRTMFKKMYDDGLIYRGSRIVNWDPKGQTTISDDEIVYAEEKTKFYYLKYGPFTIGTARPETKFGDKYVVMHPNDERFKDYQHGQKIDLEWINGPITATIVKDESIDMEFGTGVMTITPWHSVADFEIAERHKLDKEQIIDEKGKLLPIAGEFAGQHISKARNLIVEKLKSKGLLEKEEDYTHNIATAERTGGIIEPQIKLQWFIDVDKKIPHLRQGFGGQAERESLKDMMRSPVENGEIKIIPDYFNKTYFHWIDNLRPWCISRQIWYGHRIPVWYDKEGNLHTEQEKKIYFARHGESETNLSKILVPWKEHYASPLTDKGKEQAKELGNKLKKEGITKIVSSGMERSKETAKIIAKILEIPEKEIIELHNLHEVRYGEDHVGKEKGEKYNPLSYVIKNKTGETLEDLEKRAQGILEEIKKIPDEKILIVGHGTFNAVIEAVYFGKQKEKFVEYREDLSSIKNGSVRELSVLLPPTNTGLTQDEDTLDTWFSSALWTFSTLGWPEKTKDLEFYHPTDVLETGYEILFFWVARMILMTKYTFNTIPFHTVYLHGTVRDSQGRKMSKSLGNGIDPIVIAEKFGADAGRMALIIGTAPGTDSRISEDKIKGYKNFANKIWNATRFVLEQTKDFGFEKEVELDEEDKKSVEELDSLLQEITKEMDESKFYIVGEKLYHYFWHTFADIIIERSKEKIKNNNNADSAKKLLTNQLTTLIKALHPFMPFVTEEIWGMLPIKDKNLLLAEKWPIEARI